MAHSHPTQRLHFRTSDPRTSWAVLDEAGHLVSGHKAHMRQDPASTTKMATMYTIGRMIERGELRSDFFDRHAALVDRACLRSDNRAATRLATLAGGGSLSHFMGIMNREMDRIGMGQTNFTNAHGMPARNHYSTAYDMALLAHRFERDLPQFEHLLGRDRARGMRNTGHDIIGDYVDFGKTGTGTREGPNGRRSFVGGCDEGSFAILDTGRSTSIRQRFARAAHFLLHGRSDDGDDDRPSRSRARRSSANDIREITVQRGETVSAIALRIARLDGPGGIETDEAIRLLRRINPRDLADGRVDAGDEIVVPRNLPAARRLMQRFNIDY